MKVCGSVPALHIPISIKLSSSITGAWSRLLLSHVITINDSNVSDVTLPGFRQFQIISRTNMDGGHMLNNQINSSNSGVK